MSSSSDEKSAMEESRLEVMECEKEIQSIKSSLKSLTSSSGGAETSNNSLQVSVHKINASGEDSTAPGTFKVNLSSPIEERTITQLFDPLDPTAEGGIVTFEQLETSNALLTIEAFSGADDALVKVGTSAAHDLLPLCQDGEKSSSTVEIAIVSESSGEPVLESKESDEWEDAVDEEKAEDEGVAKEGDAQSPTKEAKLQLPLCTLSVQLEYTPSANDKRDSLYEKLNEVSKRKAAAIEKLRQSAAAVNRAKMAESDEGKGKGGNVVKAGFLNKSKPEAKAVPFWKRWYEKTIGPQSMLWVVGPIAKNYVIFIGCSVFFHYKGDLLALPPPV
eukprot:CAMPEP_0113375322 /NCGR_PEP_ID=MMETSP0013_2-20120614/2043_1 /TAXON_ID=2843 ORGANISM="Skeletonema costatum, Strain 1716" /NCGR_SAMPLE_ID=MMETSP0013_2 /ASSEMBLY_ACC=CAM_ASM_000158 /LENGTH=331 /DNA_ID=CAMNT_0000257347 /DNA_START=73 /DNA_END=1068 /DNA_ORIENTATION=+ /assembly_acc=CAM_ASM_000158